MTLQTIATHCRVSKATVSLVLNGRAEELGVSPATAAKITRYCVRKKYAINVNAQRINRRLIRNVGLVLHAYSDLRSPFEDRCLTFIAGGVAAEAKRDDFCTTLILSSDDRELDGLRARFQGREMDGFVMSGFPVPDAWTKWFLAERVPVVAVGEDPARGLPTVNAKERELTHALTRRIIVDSRRTRLGFLSGGPRSFVGNERKRGFLEALSEFGLEPALMADGCFREDVAFELVRGETSSGKPGMDALVCANDQMAVGAIRALARNGIPVPDRVSVAGADDLPDYKHFSPALTTFSARYHDQGVAAFRLFRQVLEHQTGVGPIRLDSQIEWREST